MKKLMLATLLASVAAFAAPGSALAGIVWSESSAGAGELLPSAEEVSGTGFNTVDAITGSLASTVPINGTPRYQVDLYKIVISDVASFSARTIDTDFDTALYLFNASGFGVYSNDDTTFDLLSELPPGDPNGPLNPGAYFLAIAYGGFIATDDLGQSIFQSGGFGNVVAADPGAGMLASWTEGFSVTAELPVQYRIALTGVTVGALAEVPEPASAALVLAAGLAAWTARRRAVRTAPAAAAFGAEVSHHV